MAQIHANDLMVGDWVMNEFGEIQQVRQLKDGFAMLYYNDWYDEDDIEGVPLTAETLEKNGFEWRAEGVVLTGEDITLVQCGDYWKVKPNQMSDDTFCYIWFVHEFQHALKNCGINKQITL